MPRPVYAEVYASVRFRGAALDPLDVTIALRLPPDHTHRQGEPRLAWTKSGSLEESSPYPHGMWAMSTRGRVRSSQLSTHVAWLLSLLEPKAAELRELLAGGVEVDVLCYSRGASSRPPSLPRSLRERAQTLGLQIAVDHYDDR